MKRPFARWSTGRRRPRLSSAAAITVFFAVAVAAVVWISQQDVSAQFKVTAQTEYLQFSTHPGSIVRLDLRNADVYAGSGDLRGVGGMLEPADSVDVAISRIGTGPVRIKLTPRISTAPAGFLHGPNLELQGEVDLVFPHVVRDAAAGENLVFYFMGRRARIGRVSRVGGGSSPLVRTGRVALIGRSFADRAFEAGSYELGPGDMVACGDTSGCGGADTVMWNGLVVADERPALNGVFATQTTEIRILRGVESYPLSVSFFNRLAGDPALAGLWLALAFLGQIVVGIAVNELHRRADERRIRQGRSGS